MKNVILVTSAAAIAAFAFAGPVAAKSMKHRHGHVAHSYHGHAYGSYARRAGPGDEPYMRSAAGAPAWGGGALAYGGAQAFPRCFKQTNTDWGFGYNGDCGTGNAPANIARLRDQRLGPNE
jgi:hypothetical protein